MSRNRRFLFPLLLLAVAVAFALSAQAEWVEKTEVRIDTFGKTIRIESDYSRLSAHHQGFLSWCTARPFVAYSGPSSARPPGSPGASGPP